MASQALPKRSTRGLRMNKLLEDEDSADEEFWNQDAFAEEESLAQLVVYCAPVGPAHEKLWGSTRRSSRATGSST